MTHPACFHFKFSCPPDGQIPGVCQDWNREMRTVITKDVLAMPAQRRGHGLTTSCVNPVAGRWPRMIVRTHIEWPEHEVEFCVRILRRNHDAADREPLELVTVL
jgi:hypothetical protein